MRNKTSLVSGAALGVMLACGLGVAAHAQDNTIAWKGAPQWTNDDVYFKVRGRILVDGVVRVAREALERPHQAANGGGAQTRPTCAGHSAGHLRARALRSLDGLVERVAS